MAFQRCSAVTIDNYELGVLFREKAVTRLIRSIS